MTEQLEAAFKKLEKDSKNNVDNLVQWMKNSKLVAEGEEGERKARQLFEEVSDKANVELEQFKGVVSRLAASQEKNLEEFMTKLNAEGPKFLEAVQAAFVAGASAAGQAYSETREKQKDK